MEKNILHKSYRLGAAVLLIALVVAEYVYNAAHGLPVARHYFFYFTIQGNLMIAFWFAAAVFLPRLRLDRASVRGALLLYGFILTTVFWVLLFPQMEKREPFPYIMTVLLHALCLAFMIGDIMVTGAKERVAAFAPLVWLGYPVFYLVLTMLRGPAAGWYPYFFLDPAKNTTASLLGWIGTLIGVFFLAGYLIFLGNRLLLKLKSAGTRVNNET